MAAVINLDFYKSTQASCRFSTVLKIGAVAVTLGSCTITTVFSVR